MKGKPNLLQKLWILLPLLMECKLVLQVSSAELHEHEFHSPIEVETGLEFLRDDFIQIDEKFFMDEADAVSKPQSSVTFLKLARGFIRSIKSLPLYEENSLNKNSESDESGGTQKADWCFSPFLLKYLAEVEFSLYTSLKKFQKSDQTSLPVLDSYCGDFEESSLRVIRLLKASSSDHFSTSNESISETDDDEDKDPYLYIATHPLLIYRMIRRFVQDLPAILADHAIDEDIVSSANPSNSVLPTAADLRDALESLARVQQGTDFKTEEFAVGKFGNLQTNIRLNALHQLEVGLFIVELKAKGFDLAIEWVNLALETVLTSPIATKKYPVIEKFFRAALDYVVSKHNTIWPQFRANTWLPSVFNQNVTLPFQRESYTRMIHFWSEEAARRRDTTEWNWAIRHNFVHVCSGANLQSDEERARLSCWLEKSRHPYWLINPLKFELLSRAPVIYQIYDFIGDSTIEKLIATGTKGLDRSRVVDLDDLTATVESNIRTSSQVWIYDDMPSGEFMRKVGERMEFLTSLKIVPLLASDAFQLACYGSSHHYDVHVDAFEEERSALKGNRITTIMGYLNNVKAGGKTGFPIAGIAAEPVKGSVVVWDSLRRNGKDMDRRTYHGGCPVALGVKWITNKWVYYNENFQTFKCDLTPEK